MDYTKRPSQNRQAKKPKNNTWSLPPTQAQTPVAVLDRCESSEAPAEASPHGDARLRFPYVRPSAGTARNTRSKSELRICFENSTSVKLQIQPVAAQEQVGGGPVQKGSGAEVKMASWRGQKNQVGVESYQVKIAPRG